MKKYVKRVCLPLLMLSLVCDLTAFAQELNCSVQINSQQIQGVERKVFDVLQTSIYEFMNNTRWTKDVFVFEERIQCNILITVNKYNAPNEFEATLQVQARRPIYKSSYFSPLLNYNDDSFLFQYLESQALDYNENTFTSNLTHVLAYYAYLILGYDYDSFSLNGGTLYYQKAQQLVTQAQNTAFLGWKPFEKGLTNNNRYWLVENLLNAKHASLREYIYLYHLKGLDKMVDDKENARTVIIDAMPLLKKVSENVPGSVTLKLLLSVKADEVVNIFSQAMPNEKNNVVNLLNEIDPMNSSKYQKISQGN